MKKVRIFAAHFGNNHDKPTGSDEVEPEEDQVF